MLPEHIREALTRPPVFGDAQQIAALKALRQEEADREGKSEYRVTVHAEYSETVTVWAEDEDEARELAMDAVDAEYADIHCRVTKI
jgi:hypothetical protein